MMSSSSDAYIDVVELCALLQCLGFNIRSLDTTDGNVSQEGGSRSVIINCQASGLQVVLDSANLSCSCPSVVSQQSSGFWQVSGMTGGKRFTKECGSALLGSLPKSHRERLTKELEDIVRCIKENNESDVDKKQEPLANKSASMLELKTSEKRLQLKSETPTRVSLDALTDKDDQLPAPGPLVKDDDEKFVCQRQSTYTLSSTPEILRTRNKTSSPIQVPSQSILDNLVAAERVAEDLRNKLSNVIRDFIEEGKHDSSMSSLALDVSKISVLKGQEGSKIQFASSPNLCDLGVQENNINRFKRQESASTSNLAAPKDGRISKLKRISPNLFKFKNCPNILNRKDKSQDIKSGKLSSSSKPKIATPVRAPTSNLDGSSNLSASRKKFSHVKSTIPRLVSKKD